MNLGSSSVEHVTPIGRTQGRRRSSLTDLKGALFFRKIHISLNYVIKQNAKNRNHANGSVVVQTWYSFFVLCLFMNLSENKNFS